MNLEDERRLKFDVRLRGRRGWVTEKELEAYKSSLPDVSEKLTSLDAPKGESSEEPSTEPTPA